MKAFSLVLSVMALALIGELSAQGTNPNPVGGGSPRVSPDGAQILFTSDRTGTGQIYLMSADGSAVRQLTDDTLMAHSPNWSPDGRSIVFASEGRILVMSAMGGDAHVVSSEPGDQSPSWSADGSKIVYSTRVPFPEQEFPSLNLHTMNPDGTGKTNLSPQPMTGERDPAWSPDGRSIAFVHGSSERGPQIWVMNPDGSGRRAVTTSESLQERPAWSPDGRYVAFQGSWRDSTTGRLSEAFVYVVDVTTGAERRLGSHDEPFFDESPSWFPDGGRLAIERKRDGVSHIYVIDLEGRVLQRLTN